MLFFCGNRGIVRDGVACVDKQPMLLYLGCLMYLRRKDELARVSQELSRKCQNKPITWYAMGCFWTSQKEYEGAKTSFAFVPQTRSFEAAH